MATQVDLGKIRPVWKGDWAASTAYEQNDMVKVGVDSYICTVAHTSGSTFADTNWDILALGAEIPSQTGNGGLVLKTDGTNMSWGQGGGYTKTAFTAVSPTTLSCPDYNNNTSNFRQLGSYSISITTTVDNSKIMLNGNLSVGSATGSHHYFGWKRGSTFLPAYDGSWALYSDNKTIPCFWIDSPNVLAGTTLIYYPMIAMWSGGTGRYNGYDAAGNSNQDCQSILSASEIVV